MGWTETAIGVFCLGLIVLVGWFVYPYLTGYQYVGTVTEVNTYGVEGFSLRIITLQGVITIGDSKTYVLAPSGISVGDYVMAKGYDRNIPGIGTVVIGTENLARLDITANVAQYSAIPFLISLGLMVLGAAAFALGLVAAGTYHTGKFFLGIWDTRKDAIDFTLKILGIAGGILIVFGYLGFLIFTQMQQVLICSIGGAIVYISILTIGYRGRQEHPKLLRAITVVMSIPLLYLLGMYLLPLLLQEFELGIFGAIIYYLYIFGLLALFFILMGKLEKAYEKDAIPERPRKYSKWQIKMQKILEHARPWVEAYKRKYPMNYKVGGDEWEARKEWTLKAHMAFRVFVKPIAIENGIQLTDKEFDLLFNKISRRDLGVFYYPADDNNRKLRF
jgi:hypothetical protein